MKKKILASILAGVFAFGVSFTTQAATRDEISAIKVSKAGNFKYWEKDALAKEKLVSYVKDITNKNSKNFIPVEDRVAVFDMDGTFICETAPYYFDHMLFIHRTLHDKNYTPSEDDRDFAQDLENWLKDKSSVSKDLSQSAPHQSSVFVGETFETYKNYVEDFYKNYSPEGLTNLKWGEAFYLPMIEIIKYLQANDFKVYVVTGTERECTRILVCDMLNIPTNQIIGTDILIETNNQDGKDGLNYTFAKDKDYLIRGKFLIKDLQMNKVSAIAREIGKQPVLAFGNSSSDASMLNYAITDNKYKSAAFFVICDDLEREFGDTKKADSCIKLAEKNNWISISMKNDWKTIYGDNVLKE